ncbi:unnamed protein product [Musa hybrid cultivar]
MASNFVLDVWGWITNLPPFSRWSTNTMCLCICTSKSTKTSLKLSIIKSPQNQNPFVSFTIFADFHMPISLWTSNPIPLKSSAQISLTEAEAVHLFFDILSTVFSYGPSKRSSFRRSQVKVKENFRDVLNLSFLTLTFLICIYEAPYDLRCGCLDTLRLQLSNPTCRDALKLLVRMLGSNLEEQWMRSLNLGMTNWMVELQSLNQSVRAISPLFSYALSASGLWKVQVYCPVIAMSLEDPSATTQDERLLFSLRYQQLEAVIQLAYKVIVKQNWIDIVVAVDNISRCDVISLVSETLMDERGYGSGEKHFPSRISLQVTPTHQSDVVSVSVSKSSDNPTQEIGLEKALEGAFEPPGTYLGLRVSTTETVTVSVKPWKFEQSVHGASGKLNWFLHDGMNGREVFSSKPSKFSLLQPKAWFRDRYSSVYRPFTKEGGVIFAGDEYGESVWWKVGAGAFGKTMGWEIKGTIGITYWPNKQRSFYSETRNLQFKELIYLNLPKAV